MKALLIGIPLLALSGCPAEETPPPPPPPPAPPPPPPPAPKAEVMDVATLNKDMATMAGQMVKVKGFVTKVEKKDTMMEVTIGSDAAGTDWIKCVTADLSMEADLMAIAPGTEETVKGTVDAAPVDGKTKLTGCAPTEPKTGKAGKKAEGGEGEGGKAGKKGGKH